MKIDDLPMHKDTYFFGYGIDIEKPTEMASQIIKLRKENQELKKQLENCYCERTDCSARIKNSKQYDSLVQKIENQQKEFMEWLEKMVKHLFKKEEYGTGAIYGYVLSKYKEIIGDKDEI